MKGALVTLLMVVIGVFVMVGVNYLPSPQNSTYQVPARFVFETEDVIQLPTHSYNGKFLVIIIRDTLTGRCHGVITQVTGTTPLGEIPCKE